MKAKNIFFDLAILRAVTSSASGMVISPVMQRGLRDRRVERAVAESGTDLLSGNDRSVAIDQGTVVVTPAAPADRPLALALGDLPYVASYLRDRAAAAVCETRP